MDLFIYYSYVRHRMSSVSDTSCLWMCLGTRVSMIQIVWSGSFQEMCALLSYHLKSNDRHSLSVFVFNTNSKREQGVSGHN